MSAAFVGIDLAWKSERNPSAAVVLRGDRAGAELAAVSKPLKSINEVLAFVSLHAGDEAFVAIDAPLVIVNTRGQRDCETAVGRRYGSRHASCHTTNLTLYPQASSVELAAALQQKGFVHPQSGTSTQPQVFMEVYPHAGMVELFDLPQIIQYKKGTVARKRAGLAQLCLLLSRLKSYEPPLLANQLLEDLLGRNLADLRGASLKDYEDSVDALFCAYLAFYFWCWQWSRNEMFGDSVSGYIVNPALRSQGIAIA